MLYVELWLIWGTVCLLMIQNNLSVFVVVLLKEHTLSSRINFVIELF